MYYIALYCFSVTGPALTSYSAYLAGRTQAYHHNDKQSQIYAVNCTVYLREMFWEPKNSPPIRKSW